VIVPSVVETLTVMRLEGSPLEATSTTTSVWATPSAGSRLRAGVTVTESPDVMSVHAPALQTNVGEPARQACPSQAESLQSLRPLQSLSTPSLQLVSLVALGGVGVQATPATQVEGDVPEHAPVPPPLRLQARDPQLASAAQFPRQATVSDWNVTWTEAVPAEPAAVIVAVPVQPRVLELQVTRFRVATALPTEALFVPVLWNVPLSVLRVADPPPVFVTVSATRFVPFATTDVREAERVIAGGGAPAVVLPLFSVVQPASAISEDATATVHRRPVMRDPSQGPSERSARSPHVPGVSTDRQEIRLRDSGAGPRAHTGP
jgi:hypothetical protein